jgi:hypothetical protein
MEQHQSVTLRELGICRLSSVRLDYQNEVITLTSRRRREGWACRSHRSLMGYSAILEERRKFGY